MPIYVTRLFCLVFKNSTNAVKTHYRSLNGVLCVMCKFKNHVAQGKTKKKSRRDQNELCEDHIRTENVFRENLLCYGNY